MSRICDLARGRPDGRAAVDEPAVDAGRRRRNRRDDVVAVRGRRVAVLLGPPAGERGTGDAAPREVVRAVGGRVARRELGDGRVRAGRVDRPRRHRAVGIALLDPLRGEVHLCLGRRERGHHLLVARGTRLVQDELVDDRSSRDGEDRHEAQRQDQRHARLVGEAGAEPPKRRRIQGVENLGAHVPFHSRDRRERRTRRQSLVRGACP